MGGGAGASAERRVHEFEAGVGEAWGEGRRRRDGEPELQPFPALFGVLSLCLSFSLSFSLSLSFGVGGGSGGGGGIGVVGSRGINGRGMRAGGLGPAVRCRPAVR